MRVLSSHDGAVAVCDVRDRWRSKHGVPPVPIDDRCGTILGDGPTGEERHDDQEVSDRGASCAPAASGAVCALVVRANGPCVVTTLRSELQRMRAGGLRRRLRRRLRQWSLLHRHGAGCWIRRLRPGSRRRRVGVRIAARQSQFRSTARSCRRTMRAPSPMLHSHPGGIRASGGSCDAHLAGDLGRFGVDLNRPRYPDRAAPCSAPR